MQTLDQIKSKVPHPMLKLIEPSISEQDVPGTLIEVNSEYYGTYYMRVCAIVSIYQVYDQSTDHGSKWFKKYHPMHQYCSYMCKDWGFPDSSFGGNIETHLVCGFVLADDNKNWKPKGTKYESVCDSCSCKPSKRLPIAMSAKNYKKWLEGVRPVSISVYEVE